MSYSKPWLCRVALYADAVRVDLALPAAVPIADLLPTVVDLVAAHSGTPPLACRLSRPGAAPLDNAKSLAQHSIQDGSVLLLTPAPVEIPEPRFDDPVEQIAAAVQPLTRSWTPAAARCTAGVAAVGLAALAGFVAVPGGPGAPNALLAAATATAAAALGMHLGGADPLLVALCGLAVLAVAAALAAVLSPFPVPTIGAVTVAAAIGMVHGAARLSIMLTGLLPQPDSPPEDLVKKARCAHRLLTGLVAAAAAAAAVGAAGTVAGVQIGGGGSLGAGSLAAVTGAALLLRSRAHTDRTRITTLTISGVAACGVALAAAVVNATPHQALWLAGLAAAAAGVALYLGGSPAMSPVARRAVELVEYPVLAAVLPLVCWICGCYSAARGMSLG